MRQARTDRRTLALLLDRIDRRLEADERLLVGVVAREAGLSPHALAKRFLAKSFKAPLGVGVGRYVTLLRLRRAADRLAFRRQMSVTEIALAAGYGSPEAFTRAFRRWHGQSPSAFRRQPRWRQWDLLARARAAKQDGLPASMAVTVTVLPDIRVALLPHRGDPALLGDTIRRFIAWRQRTGLRPPASATFNIIHGAPDACRPEEFRLDLCAATDRPVAANPEGVRESVIPGGRRAVLRVLGGAEALEQAALRLCRDWIAGSGERIDPSVPLHARRIRMFPDVAEHEAVTDLYLPLLPRP